MTTNNNDLLVQIANKTAGNASPAVIIRQKDIENNRDIYVNNILNMLDLAEASDISDGLAFYSRSQYFCQTLADNYGLALADIAAVMAILSAENSIETNMVNTADLLALGESAVVSTYNRQKYLAIAVIQGIVDPLEALSGRGNGIDKKTYCFFDNIIRPKDSKRATLDRHAITLSVGRSTPKSLISRYTKTAGKYRALERAYIEASAIAGYLTLDLQSITWHIYRRLFVSRGKPVNGRTIDKYNALQIGQ